MTLTFTSLFSRDDLARRALYMEVTHSRRTVERVKQGFTPSDGVVRLAVEQQVMGALDADQDGGVSFAELSKLGKAQPSQVDLAARQAFFADSDKDGNGVLSRAELRSTSLFDNDSLAALIGAQGAGGVGDALVKRADTDGDGKLTAREYAGIAPDTSRASGHFIKNSAGEYVAVWEEQTQAEGRAEDFARFDADKDGFLSGDELAAQFDDGRFNWGAGKTALGADVIDYVARTVDQDGDGALSLAEIKAAGESAGLADFDAASLIDDGDADHDGLLSRAELQGLDLNEGLLSSGYEDASAGQASLGRLAFAAQRNLGKVVAADLGALAAPPLRDPDAVVEPYAAGDALSVRDAEAISPTSYYDLRTNYDRDEDGVLSADEFSRAAANAGLSTMNLTSMIGAMDMDLDGKLSGIEVNRLANLWRMAAYRGEATKISALSEGEATLANLLLSVQRAPRDATPSAT